MSFAFLIVYIVLSILRPQEQMEGLAEFRIMLLVGGIGGVLAALYAPVSRNTYRSPQIWLMLLFAVAIASSLALGYGWFGGAVQVFSDFLITLITFYMIVVSADTPKRLKVAMWVIAAMAMVLVFQGALAFRYGTNADTFIMYENSPDPSGSGEEIRVPRMRAAGFMADPNDLAQVLLLSFPFVGLAWRKRSPISNALLVLLPFAWLLYGIQLTRSRGAVVSLFFLIAIWLRSRMGGVKAVLLAVLAVGVLAGFLIKGRTAGRDESADNRLNAWSQGLQLVKEHPLFGVGMNMFTEHNEITAHNTLIQCFAELGLFGYAVFWSLLLTTTGELRAMRRLPAATEDDRQLLRCARAVELSLYTFFASAFFLSRTYVIILYMLIGLAVACAGIARARNKPLPVWSPSDIAIRTAGAVVCSYIFMYVLVRVLRVTS